MPQNHEATKMVEEQLKPRNITSDAVLNAMNNVPRHLLYRNCPKFFSASATERLYFIAFVRVREQYRREQSRYRQAFAE